MKKRICVWAVSLALLSAPAAQAQSYRLGDSADEIAVIQTALTELDLYYTDITGHFGQRTERAVRLFQKKVGLPQTGVADERTLDLLYLRTNVDAPAVVQGGGTSASSGAAIAGQTLREGSSGAAVRALQERLKALDCYSGNVTGHYGRLTKEAVRRYQRANGLTADGIAGPRTLAAIQGALAGAEESRTPAPSVTATPAPGTADGSTATPTPQTGTTVPLSSVERLNTEVFLRRTSRNGHVTRLQKALKALGFFTESTTGYFGGATEEAVIAYQRARGLTADGIAGRATLRAINEDIARGGVPASID